MKSRKQSTASAVVEVLEQRRMLAAAPVPGDLALAGEFGWYEEQESGQSTAVDQRGNIYVAGYFRGIIDVDVTKKGVFELRSGKGQAGFIAKYSPAGKLVWAKRMLGAGNVTPIQVKVGPTGDVFLGGTFDGSFGFKGGNKETVLTTDAGTDAFLMRLRSDGRLLWAGNMGGSGDDSFCAMDVGADGNVYYAGAVRLEGDLDPSSGVMSIVTRGVDDTFVAKVSGSDGKLVWAKVYGEEDTSEGITGLAADGKGGVYVTGAYYRTVEFDREDPAFTLEEVGGVDIYVGHLKANGSWEWLKAIGGEEDEIGGGLALGPNGEVYVTGTFGMRAEFEQGNARSALTSLGERDAFVARYSKAGVFAWAQQFGGEDANILGRVVAVDQTSGAVYAAGEFNGTVRFGQGKRSVSLTTDKSDDAPAMNWLDASDVYIAKLTPNGAIAYNGPKRPYVKQIGGDDAGMGVSGIAVGNGGVVLTGGYGGWADLDPGPGKLIRKTSDERREMDAWWVKLFA